MKLKKKVFTMIKGIKEEIGSIMKKRSTLEKVFLRPLKHSNSLLEMRILINKMNSLNN